MASTTSGVSRRMGLAVTTAVTGVVLAAGVSVASLAGWVRPAQAVTDTQSNIMQSASATPQVVLVPIAPVTATAQPPATSANLAGALTSTARQSESTRVPHRERDDD
jgi:hypothetical protein